MLITVAAAVGPKGDLEPTAGEGAPVAAAMTAMTADADITITATEY